MKPEFDQYGMRIKRKKSMAKVKSNKISKERIDDAFAAISGEIENIWSRIGELDTRLSSLDRHFGIVRRADADASTLIHETSSESDAIRDELNYILDHIHTTKYMTADEIILYLRERLNNCTP